MKFEKVAHLYIPFKILCDYHGNKYEREITWRSLTGYLDMRNGLPVLKNLRSISEEDAVEFVKFSLTERFGKFPEHLSLKVHDSIFGNAVVSWGPGVNEKDVPAQRNNFTPDEFMYLTERKFDVFDLIKNKEAIDEIEFKNKILSNGIESR